MHNTGEIHRIGEMGSGERNAVSQKLLIPFMYLTIY